MGSLIVPALNLAILLGLLYYFLREPTKDFVRNRHSFLRDELKLVREQLEGARQKYDQFSAKLASLDQEITAIREELKADAASTSERIVKEAQKLSQTIAADAKTSAQQMVSDVKEQIRAELGAQVLVRAEQMLRERLTGDDKARLRSEFSQLVEDLPQGAAHPGAPGLPRHQQHLNGSGGRLMR